MVTIRLESNLLQDIGLMPNFALANGDEDSGKRVGESLM